MASFLLFKVEGMVKSRPFLNPRDYSLTMTYPVNQRVDFGYIL